MPRLSNVDVEQHAVTGNFTFTAARIQNLGATEYTLVDIEVDMSTSVEHFRDDLLNALKTSIEACRKSPRSDHLLVRVAAFSSRFAKGTEEVHGFIPLSEIDVTKYDNLRPGGMTPLNDACYMAAGAMNVYAKLLSDQDFLANGIMFVITDGVENNSSSSTAMIKEEIAKATAAEHLESHVSVLIAVNAKEYAANLTRFQQEVGITQFIDVGDATKGKLAKLAAFVSQSISSTSQALGTGGASQNIAAAI